MRRYDFGHAILVHIQLFLAGGEVKCAVAAYLPEERGAQDCMIYLVCAAANGSISPVIY